MNRLAPRDHALFGLCAIVVVLTLSTITRAAESAEVKPISGVATVDGMPAVLDPSNLYSRSDRHEAVSARLKVLAKDNQGKAFCVHTAKLNSYTPICQRELKEQFVSLNDLEHVPGP